MSKSTNVQDIIAEKEFAIKKRRLESVIDQQEINLLRAQEEVKRLTNEIALSKEALEKLLDENKPTLPNGLKELPK